MLWEHEPQASVSTAFSSSPKLLRVHVFYFFQKAPRREKGKQLVNFDYQNVNSLCSRHHYVNSSCQFCFYRVLYNSTRYSRILIGSRHDLLEDRRTIDVITTKFFTVYFKMAENFGNLGNILRDWAKDKVQKSLVEALNRYEKQGEER